MVIFLGNLPAEAGERDLCQMARLPAGTHLRILKKKNRDGEIIRYGLIHVETEHVSRKILHRLRQFYYQDQEITVREYSHRVSSNERRRLDWRERSWHRLERRRSERRSSGTTQHDSAAVGGRISA
jgi:uncharacterized protein YhdP